MPRRNNASNKPVYNSASYAPSPPAQLPTPLPEEHHMSTTHEAAALIDFDTPTPPPRPFVSLPYQKVDHEDDSGDCRSPPFREAQLPEDDSPPLPIRPRLSSPRDRNHDLDDYRKDEAEDESFMGHTRSPTFSGSVHKTVSTPVSPTISGAGTSLTLENLTHTIRGYMPSSIAIPTSAPSPPLISRRLGTGLFSNPPRPGSRRNISQEHRRIVGQQEFERDYELQDDDDTEDHVYGGQRHLSSVAHQPQSSQRPDIPAKPTGTSSGLALAMQHSGSSHYKFSERSDFITWARWDALNERNLLILGYSSGFQIWDYTNLSSVDEIVNLNLDSEEWKMLLGSDNTANVVQVAVLPCPSCQYSDDLAAHKRPLLGILVESTDKDAQGKAIFLLYSIQRRHQVVKRLTLPATPSTFTANEYVIIISTINSPALYILSATTFSTLYTISSASLQLFAPQVLSVSNSISSDIQPISIPGISSSEDLGTSGAKTPTSPRQPIFALSHRLLAYASPPSPCSTSSQSDPSDKETRRPSSSSSISIPGSGVSSSPFGFSLERITNITQADVGHAALKVGESVFSRMKYIGGMALEAAKNRVTTGQPLGMGTSHSSGNLDNSGRFVSRSAPNYHTSANEEAEQRVRERRNSCGEPHGHSTTVAPFTKSCGESGHYVTVVDLVPLLHQLKKAPPVKVVELLASQSQPVAKLEFAADGTAIGVALRDGHSLKIFKLRPSDCVSSFFSSQNAGGEESVAKSRKGNAIYMYNLHRGRTSAVVESVNWAKDGRYIAVGTRNRTVHIYAMNPYGGRPVIKSHLEGRVRNVEAVDFPMTTLSPITRIKSSKSNTLQVKSPLAFTFISDSELAASQNLLPPLLPTAVTHSPTLSPPKGMRGTNHQHLLLFDPEDGLLSLYRLTLEKHHPREPVIGSVAASVQALGVTSVSFPGMTGAGKLSMSPVSKPVPAGKDSEPDTDLAAKINIVATYNLKRGRDWNEVAKPAGIPVLQRRRSTGRDWLAEAELSTCSSSKRILPRSIYLSHQFSFHTLGEDYHALIRSYQFHIPGSKIDVRKEVEVSPYSPTRTSSGFAEGFPDTSHGPSSFDEPIASAISGSLDSANIPHTLPMYPNGLPGAHPKSLRNSIPIRAMAGLGDGVSESLGRIRREMHRVRSPQLTAIHPDSARNTSVPLEFDEEDENFVERESFTFTPKETSRDGTSTNSGSALAGANSTQKLLDADVVGTVDEEMFDIGWDREDKEAIEEAEQFHDIGLTGYLVEEEER